MTASKKCPHCGEWSTWQKKPSDLCQHCRGLLDPSAFERAAAQQARMAEEKKRFHLDLIQINPQDPAFTKFYKYIGLGFQVAFVGILSFILWLIALLAG